ncbi:MAG: hypothetical protein GXP35_05830 [Actinobacteria bacterium]|nr:hypothetical protein [Actinomycetota bacterium]
MNDGAVSGLRLRDGTTLASSVIVAACDPSRVFVDWMKNPPPAATRLVREAKAQPAQYGYEAKIDAILTELPRFRLADRIALQQPGLDQLDPTVFVSPNPDQLDQAHQRRPKGLVADFPTLLCNVPSVRDPSMQPGPDRHVLSLEVLFTPYNHPGGWPDSAEPERWLDLWAGLVQPGARDSIEAWRVMTPDRYETDFQMHNGHTPSFAASPLSTLVGRDRSHTRYRTPVSGLYLSGAGTFPGAGIFGAPGRNAADRVERDLRGGLGTTLLGLRQTARAEVSKRLGLG